MTPSALKLWYRQNAPLIAGLDEAGRGPLAGPAVTCAVVLDPKKRILGLNDSKQLSEKKREALYDSIQEKARAVAVHVVDVASIDQLNILWACVLGMQRCFAEVQTALSGTLIGALVDGNQRLRLDEGLYQATVVQGDAIFQPIMAASIVAKVTRDRLMNDLSQICPGYGFERHKGYGTAEHLAALRKLGPTKHHRMSFAPVREAMDGHVQQAAFNF